MKGSLGDMTIESYRYPAGQRAHFQIIWLPGCLLIEILGYEIGLWWK